MSFISKIDEIVSKFTEEDDDNAHDKLLSEVLKMIGMFSETFEYKYYLKSFIPIFIKYLKTIPISFQRNSPKNKKRNTIFEILHRAHMNEMFQPYALEILDTLMDIFTKENEENGLLCLNIITGLYVAYKNIFEDRVLKFVEILGNVYQNMNQTIHEEYEKIQKHDNNDFTTNKEIENLDLNLGNNNTNKILKPSMYSFKIYSESSITMISLFSSYKQTIEILFPFFIAKLFNSIILQFYPLETDSVNLRNNNENSIKEMKPEHRNAYSSFILGQIKACSFLAYIFIKEYPDKYLTQEQLNILPDLIIRLLKNCPYDFLSERKELLYVLKYMLSTSFKSHFFSKIDVLLDEKILLGEGLTSHKILRSLAYSTIADFIINVKNDLSPLQIWAVFKIYSSILKDNSFTLNVQIMSAKLIVSLVENILKFPDKSESRQMFMIILDIYSKKFNDIKKKYNYILYKHNEYCYGKKKDQKKKKNISLHYYDLHDNKFSDCFNEFDLDLNFFKQSSKNEENTIDNDNFETKKFLYNIDTFSPVFISKNNDSDALKNYQFFFRTLLIFLKSIVFGLKNCNIINPLQNFVQDSNESSNNNSLDTKNEFVKIKSIEELNVFRALFRNGISCLSLFFALKPKINLKKNNFFYFFTGGPSLPITSSKEEKSLMEIFATIFIHVDPVFFNQIVTNELSFLFESTLKNVALLHLAQFFLATEVTSANFLCILLLFLKSNLNFLRSDDFMRSNISIRLFKLCFMSVNLFPKQNEKILLQHINYLIFEFLNFSNQKDESMIHLYLLKILFRSISGGCFESLYKEIINILPILLEKLHKMMNNSYKLHERDVYVELCLTIPVRLSVLIPHLNYLTRALVYGFRGSQELVNQSLRIFELCIDNLTAEYFDPIIEPYINEIMESLWNYLEPVPHHHQHFHTAIRILGKLGGRNHKHFKHCNKLVSTSVMNLEVKVFFLINGLGDKIPVNVTPNIESALKLLNDTSVKIHYRINAYNYLSTILKLFIDSTLIPKNYLQMIKYNVNLLIEKKLDDTFTISSTHLKNETKLNLQNQLVLRLLKSLFFSISIPEVCEKASVLINFLTTHFVFLYLNASVVNLIKETRPFSVNDSEGDFFLSESVFINAICYALTFWNSKVRDKGLETIRKIGEISLLIFESTERMVNFPLFDLIFNSFVNLCYDEMYYKKIGGILGFKSILEDLNLPSIWLYNRQFEIIRSIFFILKDTVQSDNVENYNLAKSLVLDLLRKCNHNLTNEQIVDKPFQNLISFLVCDLSNLNPLVRKVSQNALEVLSETTSTSISKLMFLSKNLLLNPIFSKPLRALPFLMQIGNVSAITFCLELPDSFLTFDEKLNRLVLEALALVDAEDEFLTNINHYCDYKTSNHLIELRVVCINLLSLVYTKSEFVLGTLSEARIKILEVFFKALCNKSTKIINAAYNSLKYILQKVSKLPKDLLQNGLRPLLMNLSDHKKLTVFGLQALAKLLELLISYFRVEIGCKLLEYLMEWAQINVLQQIDINDLNENHVIKIILAILKIFYLLPSKAHIFTKDIMKTLEYLETNLKFYQNSSFREPVSKFLNRFSEYSIEYYISNFQDQYVGNTLSAIIGMDHCENLRVSAKTNFNKFVLNLTNETNENHKLVKFSNIVDLINSIVKHDPKWIVNKFDFFILLFNILENIVQLNGNLSSLFPFYFDYEKFVEKFQLILVKFVTEKVDQIDSFFVIINQLFNLGLNVSIEFEDLIYEKIVSSDDLNLKVLYLNKCIEFFFFTKILKTKNFIIQKIFNLILIYEAESNGNIDFFFNDSRSSHCLELISKNIWSVGINEFDTSSGPNDFLKYNLLEMTCIFITSADKYIKEYSHNVFNYLCICTRCDDNIIKHLTCLVICYYTLKFNVSSSFVFQIFTSLLHSNQIDSRGLVQKSLNILIPKLLISKNQSQEKSWIKILYDVLLKNGFNVPQVFNIYQFIVQNPDIFYTAREHFIPFIINSMGKLTVLANSSLENQTLALNLATIILNWESISNSKDKNIIKNYDFFDQEFITSSNYSIPDAQKEACITFLIRYVCINSQKIYESEHCQTALIILNNLLSPDYWNDIDIKLSFFKKILLNTDLNSPTIITYCLNSLEVLKIVLKWKSAEWITENIAYLHDLFENLIKCNNQEIYDSLQHILDIVLKAINSKSTIEEFKNEAEIKNFTNLLSSVLTENLCNASLFGIGITLSWTLSNYFPSILNLHIPLIIKVFSKLCKSHINLTHQKSQNSDESLTFDHGTKLTVTLLIKIIVMLSIRIATLGDQRRIFLSLLAQLIEHTLQKDLFEIILKIVKKWVFSKSNLFPTIKENAIILSKMLIFEIRGEPDLSKEFYQIIIDIFEDEAFKSSELTIRMEHPFLVGTRSANVQIRKKLMSILNNCLENDIRSRLYFVICEQNWKYLSDYLWLNQALQLLFGAFDFNNKITLVDDEYKFQSIISFFNEKKRYTESQDTDSRFEELIENHNKFLNELKKMDASEIINPLIEIFYQSDETIHSTWVSIFPVVFSVISKSEYLDFNRFLVILLSKDFHVHQVDNRPNTIQSLLEGISKCEKIQLPSFAIECLASHYNAWSHGINILENIEEQSKKDNKDVLEVTQDALLKLFALLKEDDMFYGLWKKRSVYEETIFALLYEQIGYWEKAQQIYESAQIKTRSGALSYKKSEYSLWEDHWIICAENLQQWDILTDLSKHEGFSDLLLECGWRIADWNNNNEVLTHTLNSVIDVPTPRRKVFEMFLCLQGFIQEKKTLQDLSKLCDNGIQLLLKKAHSLPTRFYNSHIPLLHMFQQYVEFMEASQVYSSLLSTNAQNLDSKSQELKRVLQVWRERLPNIWDDINIWNDLISWRQHVFQTINKVYMPFTSMLQKSNSGENMNSYAYRGFHEIAWVINRFAHVNRKHNMSSICIKELSKIYKLPNIEVQEAFLKLKEQFKCYYKNENDLDNGLKVISSTNLVYFNTQQKSEFFTLKGLFFDKLNQKEEANKAFAISVQIDLNSYKAWNKWGAFNDKRFKEYPNEIVYANNALSCYLQAAGLYKNSKTRKLLARILWLLSLDDSSKTLSQAFENFRGEVPVWYWISFIPQLLLSLSYNEGNLTKQILVKIAKSYPQALYFQLRSFKEDLITQQQNLQNESKKSSTINKKVEASFESLILLTKKTDDIEKSYSNSSSKCLNDFDLKSKVKSDLNNCDNTSYSNNFNDLNNNNDIQNPEFNQNKNPFNQSNSKSSTLKTSIENIDQILGILKTTYPLLSLSLESLVDQINSRFESTPDEDTYKHCVSLLNDGIQLLNRLNNSKDEEKIMLNARSNVLKFSQSIAPEQIKTEFEKDFLNTNINLKTFILKLIKWRNRFEDKLDTTVCKISLESICPHLSDFHHQKFEEIEIPGQYSLNKDNNNHFVKIERFLTKIDLVRESTACYKRITIRGHDGSLHLFLIQFSQPNQCRRDEFMFQLFQFFDISLQGNVETKKRFIHFTVPIAVPLSSHVRIINDNKKNITLSKIYEDNCKLTNINRDKPFLYTYEKLKSLSDQKLTSSEITGIRIEIFNAIQALMVSPNTLKNYFIQRFPQFEDFWLFRKQFTSQYASFIFSTYMMCINARYPQKIHFNISSGDIWTSEMLLCKIASKNLVDSSQKLMTTPLFHNVESVPFRLTPNIQRFIGETGMEGILTVYIFCISKALTDSDSYLEYFLTLFVRDEVITWVSKQSNSMNIFQDKQLKEMVLINVELIIKKVNSMCQILPTTENTNKHILDLISQAVNPYNLASNDCLWMPYF